MNGSFLVAENIRVSQTMPLYPRIQAHVSGAEHVPPF